ncbi:unnamed protein product [Sphenostylis stenocarpa]|uniref:Carrier domain-containing protein n=1 Tax=Sphenostylis stenocarpa TaxID=92480 RepID=A0AA86VPL1_9FABA|nr:unnamed protein product [Sphenostylis stenocarpa]
MTVGHLIQMLAQGLAQFQAMGGGMFLLARSRAQFALEFLVRYDTTSEGLQPSFEKFYFSRMENANPETVEKVCKIVKNQLALPDDSKVTGESTFAALGADSLDTVKNILP